VSGRGISNASPKYVSNVQSHLSIAFPVSWYPRRLDDNVLWLHYEDLIQDLRGCVKLIAEFLDIGVNDNKLQDLVTKQVTNSTGLAHDLTKL